MEKTAQVNEIYNFMLECLSLFFSFFFFLSNKRLNFLRFLFYSRKISLRM